MDFFGDMSWGIVIIIIFFFERGGDGRLNNVAVFAHPHHSVGAHHIWAPHPPGTV